MAVQLGHENRSEYAMLYGLNRGSDLWKIRDILADETLSDETCFRKIEAIVSLLEEAGISPGGRHDFG